MICWSTALAEVEALAQRRSALWISLWVLNESNAVHEPEKRVEKFPIEGG
jgi:hypothetical protein